MVQSLRAAGTLVLLSVPFVHGQSIPPECDANPLLAGGNNPCAICPPGEYASSAITASVFGNSMDCFSWSLAALCGRIPGGQMGCGLVAGQLQAACAPSCKPLLEFTLPTLAPTPSPTEELTLDYCKNRDPFIEPCGSDKFKICIEKKGKQKDECHKAKDELKDDETLIKCGSCNVVPSTTTPPPPSFRRGRTFCRRGRRGSIGHGRTYSRNMFCGGI